MKTLIQTITFPQKPIALLVFSVLAFLPSVLHLACQNLPVTNPFAAVGPIVAAFWFAAGIREIRVNAALLGALITTLLWSVNWLMFAGHACCSTING
jgi:hypothetical protein